MTAFKVGFNGTVLYIPASWTRFVYKGLIYERLVGTVADFSCVGSTK
jgi:hypothetical protein